MHPLETASAGASLPAQRLCASEELIERGPGLLFDVTYWREPMRAFALRIDGRPVAYLNRCAHVPTELDWQPGQFLDDDGQVILCTVHGAAYEPSTGRCVGGPCGRGRLLPLDVRDEDGEVRWYPSPEIRPRAAAAPAPSAGQEPPA